MLQTVDRIKTLHRMSICGLNTKNTHQYSVTTLLMTCDRIEKHGLVEYLSSDLYERVQRGVIPLNRWFKCTAPGSTAPAVNTSV